jgi:predicted DNA-binding transcriptional regulator AlpA
MGRHRDSETSAATITMDRRLMTRGEAAAYLGVSQATLSRWASERTGPAFVKLHEGDAGSVRYPSDLLASFLESRIKQPKA